MIRSVLLAALVAGLVLILAACGSIAIPTQVGSEVPLQPTVVEVERTVPTAEPEAVNSHTEAVNSDTDAESDAPVVEPTSTEPPIGDPVLDPDGLSYRWLVRIATSVSESQPDVQSTALWAQGAVDPASDYSYVAVNAADAYGWSEEDRETSGADVQVERVQIGHQVWSRGIDHRDDTRKYAPSVELTAWYETDAFGEDGDVMDLLGDISQSGDLLERLGAGVVTVQPAVDWEAAAVVAVAVTEGQWDAALNEERPSLLDWIGNLGSDDVVITMGSDALGRLTMFRVDSEEDPNEVTFEFSDFGVPVEPVTVVNPQQLPEVEGVELPITTTELDRTEVLRVYTFGAYRSPGGQADVSFSLEPDGSVMRINDGDVLSGAQSYVAWNIGEDGYQRVLAVLAETALLEPSDRTVETSLDARTGVIAYGRGRSVSLDAVFATRAELSTDLAFQQRQAFVRFFEQLDDMSWLVDEGYGVTERELWLPDRLTFAVNDLADGGDDVSSVPEPRGPVAVWPFELSIEEMVSATDDRGRPVVCLVGGDAALAWQALIMDGVNHAHLEVDDGHAHRLSATISYPGYVLYGDPCS